MYIFKQAYDSINRLRLCIIMREIGTPTKTANLSKLILRETMNKVQIVGTLADSTQSTRFTLYLAIKLNFGENHMQYNSEFQR